MADSPMKSSIAVINRHSTRLDGAKNVESAMGQKPIEFQAWECVSLIRNDGTTFDIVVKDNRNLMALLAVMSRKVMHPVADDSYIKLFIKLKFKMKLSYECWAQKTTLDKLVLQAIERSVAEKFVFARSELQGFLSNEDGVPRHN